MAKQHHKAKCPESEKKPEKPKPRKLFADCGRPYNLNEPKLTFSIEECSDRFVLDVHIYKYVLPIELNKLGESYSRIFFLFRYLETSLLDVDVQPNYVRVTVKGKIFQLALSDEVKISDSSSRRSTTTGHLLIVMPKLVPSNQIKSNDDEKGNWGLFNSFESYSIIITLHSFTRFIDKINETVTREKGKGGSSALKKHVVELKSSGQEEFSNSEIPPLC